MSESGAHRRQNLLKVKEDYPIRKISSILIHLMKDQNILILMDDSYFFEKMLVVIYV